MTLQSVAFAALQALYVADNGSGGLGYTGGDQPTRVRFFIREGSREHTPERLSSTPTIVVSMTEDNDDALEGSTASGGSLVGSGATLRMRFTVYAQRNDDGASRDAVLKRLRDLLRGRVLVPSSPEGWLFAPIKVFRPLMGPSGGNSTIGVLDAEVLARGG